uniref:G_PROTEIN_RECEP_F1_2 domain-containing protein n=1 Tax=Caenorhabditis tropicalis TaxID=1561998 RepID=A0A1I7URX6_9PELO
MSLSVQSWKMSNSTSPNAAATVANIAYCYVLPCICAIGIVGNITNLMVLASRRLRAVSYMYLRALAVADLLCMLFVLVFVSTEYLAKNGSTINQYKLYQIYQCHMMLTLINWALGAGVYVVVALSLERYISIVFPMHFRTWNSPQRATRAIVIAFLIPAIFYVPYAVTRYKGKQRFDPIQNVTIYSMDDHPIYTTFYWQIYKWTREAFLRFLPIIILTVLNIQIMVAFRKRQKMFQQLTKRKEQGTQKDDTLMYMLGGTVLMSLVCNIPAAINLLLIDETLKKRLDYQIFRAVANLLEITNHASQFYVFCACSTDYRTTFLQKFPCFKTDYANRDRLRSFVRRTQSVIQKQGSVEHTTNSKVWILFKSKFQRDSLSHHSRKFSRHMPMEQDTVDIQLASGEQSTSGETCEADTLIKYGGSAQLCNDENNTTFL